MTLLRLHLRMITRTTVAWAVTVAVALVLIGVGYADSYRAPGARALLQAQMERAQAFTTLYGPAQRVDTVGGFLFWRMGSLVLWLASGWGLLTATRITRGEEEIGRSTLVLAGSVDGRAILVAQCAAIGGGAATLGLVTTLTTTALTGDPAGSFAFGVSVAFAAFAFAGIGAVASQLTARRRDASMIGALVLALALVVRMIGDARQAIHWLSWLTPFGWYERVQPFSGNDLRPLALAVALAAGTWLAAATLRTRRDEGAAVTWRAEGERTGSVSQSGAGKRRSPLALAARSLRFSTMAWAASVSTFGVVFGLLSGDLAVYAREDPGSAVMMQRFGLGNLVTAAGFVGLSYHYLALALAVFAALATVAVRDEELSGRADLLLAQPYLRQRWLAERWLVAAVALVAVATACGVSTWLGAAVVGNEVTLVQAVGGSTNCVPVGLIFLGFGFLVLGLRPGAALPAALAAVVSLYLLEIAGLLLRLPRVILDLSPFYRTQIYPAFSADLSASFGMTFIGMLLVVTGVVTIGRRDVRFA